MKFFTEKMAVSSTSLTILATVLLQTRYVNSIAHFITHPVQIYKEGRVQSVTLVFSTVVRSREPLLTNITTFLATRPIFKGPDKELHSLVYSKKVAQVQDILGECNAYLKRLQQFKTTVHNGPNLHTHPCSSTFRPFDNHLPGNVAKLLKMGLSKLESTDIETAFRWLNIIQFDVQQLTKKVLEYIITLNSVKQEILFGIYAIPFGGLNCEIFDQYNVKNIDCKMVNEEYFCNFDIVEKVQIHNARKVYAIPYKGKTFLKTPLFLINGELKAGNCPERDFCAFKNTGLPIDCEKNVIKAIRKQTPSLDSCPLYDEYAPYMYVHNMPLVLQTATLNFNGNNFTILPPTLLYLNESAVLYMNDSSHIDMETNSKFFLLDTTNLTMDNLSIYTEQTVSEFTADFEEFFKHILADWPTLIAAILAYSSVYIYNFLGGLCRRKHFDRQQRRIYKGKKKNDKNQALVAFLGHKN